MDLGDAQLRQLMEDLQQEVAHRELNMPSRGPTMGGWRIPAREGDPNVDDEEVIFLGGRGWELRGQPPQPTCPPQMEEDIGCLINTLATRMWLGTLRINTFSGEATLGKTEVSFEQWYPEVQCVEDHYLESVVWKSLVRLLNGAVADMAQYMVPTTSMVHILQKLTVIFGTVTTFDVLMQNFYKVTQGNHEKVPSFATRLEGTLNQIRLQYPRSDRSNSTSKIVSSTGSTNTLEIP